VKVGSGLPCGGGEIRVGEFRQQDPLGTDAKSRNIRITASSLFHHKSMAVSFV
jgi:hypothetical protein